jgi:hypothetical protein
MLTQEKTRRTPAPPGVGSVHPYRGRWRARIRRQKKEYSKLSKSKEVAEAWLEEMRRTIPTYVEPPAKVKVEPTKPKPKTKKKKHKKKAQLTTSMKYLWSHDYERIIASSKLGAAENVRKYRAMAYEARVAADAARSRRDAAAAKIRKLQEKLGIKALE